MRQKDSRGLMLLAAIIVIVVAGFWFTMKAGNLRNEPTGGTPFAQQPSAVGSPGK